MPHQQLIADVLGEIDPGTGRLAYTEGIVTIPRQQGKTVIIEAKFCHRGTAARFFGPRQRMTYTAQTRIKAREKLEEDFIPDLEAAAAWKGRFHAALANGNEHIRFANGSRMGLEASTEKAGHGGTLDEAYLDEAFAHQDFRLEQAFGPAMITRANKLLLVISTAGWLGGSPYLEAKVEAGRRAARAGRGRGRAYFEWAADPDADPGAEQTWLSCMPAVGHTIRLEDIRAEYEKALDQGTLNEFRRSYLNQWVAKDQPDTWTVIAERDWRALADPKSEPGRDVAFAVVFAADRSRAAVAVAGWREDRLLHAEVADYRPGTDWVAGRVAEMERKHQPCTTVVDAGGHEASVIEDLRALRVQVLAADTRGIAQAYGQFYDAVADGTLRHRGQPDLDDALACAVTRDVGDGGKAWGRRKSGGDISPLVAVTNAAWGLRKLVSPYHGEPSAWLI